MKNSKWIGLLAIIALVASCFLPWAYYPDLHKTFTGFYSHNNAYGKPGKVLIILAIPSLLCFLAPRVWAKRLNLFISALMVAYAFRSFIVFAGCYRGICPEKKEGLWVMIISAILIMVMAVVPDINISGRKKS